MAQVGKLRYYKNACIWPVNGEVSSREQIMMDYFFFLESHDLLS